VDPSLETGKGEEKTSVSHKPIRRGVRDSAHRKQKGKMSIVQGGKKKIAEGTCTRKKEN